MAIIFSQVSTRRITFSLSKLVRNAKKIADGDYSISTKTESYIEINELSHDFAMMASAIKAREDEIRRVNIFLDSIIENIPNMIFVKDARSFKYIRINKSVEDLLGYARESIIGKEDHDYLQEEELDLFISRDREVLENGKLLDIPEEMIKTKNRGDRILRTKIIPIFDENNEPRYLLGISEDITDFKKMEEELLNAKKLESVGILAGGIAHDFNNILTAILGNMELAKMYAGREGKILERLAQAEKAALRAKDLTRQLLTFSRGGAPVKRLTSMIELLKETAAFALSGSNVTCEFKISDRLFPADVDEGQISQVINNLVINADQSMPEGGRITIYAENVTVEPEESTDSAGGNNQPGLNLPLQKGNYIKVVIQDHGKGIPEEDQARIFDPYFTKKEGGSGLGLASAYSIVKRHEGHISVKSEVGIGTAFTVYLPAAEGNLPSKKSSEAQKVSMKGKALVMDDEEPVRSVLSEMLGSIGYKISLAEDGAEAVELYSKAKASNRPFDVVFMDLTVPGGMGGKEAVKVLLEIDPDVKVIVTSGYSNDPVMADYKSFGFAGVVAKPFKLEDLSETLKDVAGKG
ncbi:Sensor histidine kinase RcsC [subsurface metagenome]